MTNGIIESYVSGIIKEATREPSFMEVVVEELLNIFRNIGGAISLITEDYPVVTGIIFTVFVIYVLISRIIRSRKCNK